MKIRVPTSALWISLFQSLGAAPGGIDFSDVYPALQAKIFEAQENPLAIISTAKLYGVQSYCSLTNHMWDGWWLLMNGNAWERLPHSIQEIVSRNLNAAALAQRRDVAALNSGLRDDLLNRGLVFNEVDPTPFREKLRQSGFYVKWRSEFGEEACSLLFQTTGKLA